MKTFGSLFTGFDGVGIGAKQAGLDLAWGLELRPDVAEVANGNLGGHVRVGDILKADPYDFDAVDALHASPPCTRASSANQSAGTNEEGTKESSLDIALAEKVMEFIRVLQPSIFTLENVIAYRQFQSWRGGKKTIGIEPTLYECGYWPSVEYVDMSDHGVPQSRKRMIVRAVRGDWVPYLPQADRQIGWYEAIEDLIPTLPESQFAPWQLRRLSVELDEPGFCVLGRSEAFIVDCQNGGAPSADKERGLIIRYENEPMFTLTASMQKRPARAALSDGRIVAMTPRALARFQTFPDWYEFDCTRTLAAYGIGNAVPCEFARRMYAGLTEN